MDFPANLQLATPVTLGMALGLTALALVGFALLRVGTGGPIALARSTGLLALRALILLILVLILINPVRVAVTPGTVERPKVVYLVDTSQSMALGQKATRWEQVLTTIRTTDRLRDPSTAAQISVFRFGSRLAAVEPSAWREAGPETSIQGRHGQGEAHAEVAPGAGDPPLAPADPDTLLVGALGELAGRFGQSAPQAVVMFSDGRARDPAQAESIARGFGLMKVPIHVVPVGEPNVGGDVAIVSMVAPPQVRKHSRVAVQVFLRSFGYTGRRVELKLAAAGPAGSSVAGAVLGRTPLVLQDGVMSATITFESGDEDRRIEARIDPLPGEVSLTNNAFAADVAIDHTKIRVLYLEGAVERYVEQVAQRILRPGQSTIKGAYSPLQQALMEDPDIECTVVVSPGGEGDFGFLQRVDEPARGLPESPSEWFAYDAIILSNMPREALSDQQLAWVDEWISRRGGGLAMVGGPYSFATGRWADTPIGAMLPVALLPGGDDWEERPTSIARRVQRPAPDLAYRHRRFRESCSAQGLTGLRGKEPPGKGQAGRGDACRRRGGWPRNRDRRATLWPGTDDGDDHRDQPPLGERFQPDLGRKRRALLQEVLAECGVLAYRELVDRPAAAPRRDRQAALQPRRTGRHPRPHLRRECRPDTRLPRDRDGRAGLGRRCHFGRLSPAASDGHSTPVRAWHGSAAGSAPPLGGGVLSRTPAHREVLYNHPADRRRKIASPR